MTLRSFAARIIVPAACLLALQAQAASLGNQNVSCSASLPGNTVNLSGQIGDTFTITNTSNTNSCGGLTDSSTSALPYVVGTTGVNDAAGFLPQYVGGTADGPNSNVATVTLAQSGTHTISVTSNFGGTTTFSVSVGGGAGPATVPTLGEYGLLTLTALMAAAGGWRMRRRGKQA